MLEIDDFVILNTDYKNIKFIFLDSRILTPIGKHAT